MKKHGIEFLEKPRKPSGGYRPRHFERFLEEEQEGIERLREAAKLFLTQNYDKSMMQKVGSFFGIGGASKFEESMTISSDDVRRMIQEELQNILDEDQSMLGYGESEERILFSYINQIKADNPGISHEEAVEMAQDQMEADNMGMEPYEYAASEKRGETMPVRESRRRKKK